MAGNLLVTILFVGFFQFITHCRGDWNHLSCWWYISAADIKIGDIPFRLHIGITQISVSNYVEHAVLSSLHYNISFYNLDYNRRHWIWFSNIFRAIAVDGTDVKCICRQTADRIKLKFGERTHNDHPFGLI